MPNWIDSIIADVNITQKTLQSSKRIVLIKRKVNFYTAMRICQTIDGKIVLPVSSKENQEVIEFVKGNIGDTGFWLRISDEYEEGTWKDTLDQSELDGFTHWVGGEPNNSGGVEHYGMVHTVYWKNTNGAGSWNDYSGSKALHILCEFQ